MAYQDEATEAAEMDINNPARRGLGKLVRVDMDDPARMGVVDSTRIEINNPAQMMHYPQMTYAMERREDRVVHDRLDVVDGDDDNVRSGKSADV